MIFELLSEANSQLISTFLIALVNRLSFKSFQGIIFIWWIFETYMHITLNKPTSLNLLSPSSTFSHKNSVMSFT